MPEEPEPDSTNQRPEKADLPVSPQPDRNWRQKSRQDVPRDHLPMPENPLLELERLSQQNEADRPNDSQDEGAEPQEGSED